MELTKDIQDLLASGADPPQVAMKLNESYLPKEKLMSLEDLRDLAFRLREAGATPPTICRFVLNAVEGHRIQDHDQNSLGGHGIPPNYYIAGNIADVLYGNNLEPRMKYASFRIQTSLDRDIPGYESMRHCMGRASDEFFHRDWDLKQVIQTAKKMDLVRNPTDGHKLIHAFPDPPNPLGSPDYEGAAACFNLLKPEYAITDIFSSYLHEAWYDYDRTSGAWGIYEELEEVLPLFAKEGLTPKDAALGLLQSDFSGWFMLGIMKGLGFSPAQIEEGIGQASKDYIAQEYDHATAFGRSEDQSKP